jgi:mRNA-degrading endonuclease RelE of RelBE toxin-antitoxin system
MPTICLKPRAVKFIKSLPPKHKEQVKKYILSLQNDPMPHDVRPLTGYSPYVRADVGEYRIIYIYDSEKDLITVVLVGKRNDGSVYRTMKRII